MTCYLAICCLLALSGSTLADGSIPLEVSLQHTLDQWTYPRYAYNYAVNDPHTGDNKAQWEQRDGDVVKGSYSLVEPDGSLRVVDYAADDHSGFNAVVKRLGPNLHPASLTPISLIKPLGEAPIVVNPALSLLPSAPLTGHSPLFRAVPIGSPILRTAVPLPLLRAGRPIIGLRPAWGSAPWILRSGSYGGLVNGKNTRPIRHISISAKQNGRLKWIAGPIPVIPGKVFVVKHRN